MHDPKDDTDYGGWLYALSEAAALKGSATVDNACRKAVRRAADKYGWLEEQIKAQSLKLEDALKAGRTREDYNLRCACGAPHWFDTSLPSDVWNRIATPDEILCLLCIDERLKAAGIHAEARFYFVGKALTSELYADDLQEQIRTAERLGTAATAQINELQLRLDECRESCARAVAARDVATSRLDAALKFVRDQPCEYDDCPGTPAGDRPERCCDRCRLKHELLAGAVERPLPKYDGAGRCNDPAPWPTEILCKLPPGHDGDHSDCLAAFWAK